ncbi:MULTISPECIES: hypothetical protein [unclassified Haloarcula]|uniref:hypothetical protein n=1 Tax=unclassified Haloarcula TaxID=2624677 RepID=UPI0018E3BFF6|nr:MULTISPECIES: hypothetical protein [Haloarcula]
MGTWFLSDGNQFGIIMLVFCGIALTATVSDIRQFRATDLEPRTWFFEHIQRMGGAYIATITAFISTNVRDVSVGLLPVIWLTLVAVGTTAVWYVSRQYRAKFDRGTDHQPAVVQE